MAAKKPKRRRRKDTVAKHKNKPGGKPSHSKTVPEVGGRTGPDPTRYGDWEKNGRCVDF